MAAAGRFGVGRFGAWRAMWASVFGGAPRVEGGAAAEAKTGAKTEAKTRAIGVDAAPPAWVAYARQVALCLQTTLADSDASAPVLAVFFDRQSDSLAQGHGHDIPVPRLKTWIDARGRIERIACVPRCADDAAAALDSVLVGRYVGEVPPRDMIQPIVVRLDMLMEADGDGNGKRPAGRVVAPGAGESIGGTARP